MQKSKTSLITRSFLRLYLLPSDVVRRISAYLVAFVYLLICCVLLAQPIPADEIPASKINSIGKRITIKGLLTHGKDGPTITEEGSFDKVVVEPLIPPPDGITHLEITWTGWDTMNTSWSPVPPQSDTDRMNKKIDVLERKYDISNRDDIYVSATGTLCYLKVKITGTKEHAPCYLASSHLFFSADDVVISRVKRPPKPKAAAKPPA